DHGCRCDIQRSSDLGSQLRYRGTEPVTLHGVALGTEVVPPALVVDILVHPVDIGARVARPGRADVLVALDEMNPKLGRTPDVFASRAPAELPGPGDRGVGVLISVF